jgi:hypothetical protein
MPRTTERNVWDLVVRGKNKVSVITTIDKNSLSDFQKAAEILYARKKINSLTPYACSSYFVKIGIKATLESARK